MAKPPQNVDVWFQTTDLIALGFKRTEVNDFLEQSVGVCVPIVWHCSIHNHEQRKTVIVHSYLFETYK